MIVNVWRRLHSDDLLTQEQVNKLPTGSIVEIVWSGGNGPHQYTIEQWPSGTHWRSNGHTDAQWENMRKHQDPITFVGSFPFHTQVICISKSDSEKV